MLPTFNLQIEKWKWNKEFKVWVSNMGNFRNKKKEPIPLRISRQGYMMVPVLNGYKQAHRLVMLTWCPIPHPENYTVDHKNHNKRENSYKNLEWVTKEENQRRALRDVITTDEDRLADREKSLQRNKNREFEICYGNKKFESFNQAASYIMQKQGMQCNKDASKVRNIKKQIWNSIVQKKPYCKKCWVMNFK